MAEVYQQRWLEESGLSLENVDLPHLVLASGKPVLQKGRICATYSAALRKGWNLADDVF